jgi:hypothetical protein
MTEALHHLNYVAVLVVAIVGFIFGCVWCRLVYSGSCKSCDTAAAPEGEKPAEQKSGVVCRAVKSFVFTLVSTWGLALLIESHGTLGRRHGAEFGAAVGLLIVGARFANDGAWRKTPSRTTATTIAHEVLLFAIQGAILGIWR